jgi:hypothetical protein
MRKFIVVQCDNMQGIYLDGFLVTQDYLISAIALLKAMSGYQIDGRIDLEIREADPVWFYNRTGHLPQTIDKVKFKVYA